MPRPRAALRLFGFPFAGGNAGAFDSWAVQLPTEVEVCGVQYPGRRERIGEPAARRMSQLLTALEKGIVPYLDRPYVLCGNSLGATVAYEFTRRLERHGLPLPARLVASSARAPHLGDRLPDYQSMSDEQFVAELVTLGTMSPHVADHPELLAASLPTLRADCELACTYRYRDTGRLLSVPIDAISGSDDPFVSVASVRSWSELTTAEFTMTRVAGAHEILVDSADDFLAAVCAACLRALSPASQALSDRDPHPVHWFGSGNARS